MTTLLLLSVLAACPPADSNGDGRIAINEVIAVVNLALGGCDPPDRFLLDDTVVRDRQTGLIWEARGCSEDPIPYAQAEARAADFNRRRVAGRQDWRIPTVANWLTIEDGIFPTDGFNVGHCPCEPPACNQTLNTAYWSSDVSNSGLGKIIVSPLDWETDGSSLDYAWEARLVAGP